MLRELPVPMIVASTARCATTQPPSVTRVTAVWAAEQGMNRLPAFGCSDTVS